MHINTLRPRQRQGDCGPLFAPLCSGVFSPDRLTTSRACCADVHPSGLSPSCFCLTFSFCFSRRLCFTNIDRLSPRHRLKIALSSPRASHLSCIALALCCSTSFPRNRGLVSSRTSLSRPLRPGYLHLQTDPRGFYTR